MLEWYVRYGDETVAVMGRSTIGGGVMWMSVPYTQAGEGRSMSGLAGVIDTSGALSEASSSQSSQSSRGYKRESRLQEEIRQHREAMQRQEEWARQQHEYMQKNFAQQRQLQVLCKFDIFQVVVHFSLL
jgi:hypothetical protein